MRISLENIGSIERATVDLDGITVIAGENNTGKSTVGKALWAFFNSLSGLNERIEKERRDTVYRTLQSAVAGLRVDRYGSKNARELRAVADRLSDECAYYREHEEGVAELVSPLFDEVLGDSDADETNEEKERAIARLIAALSYDDSELANSIVKSMLDSEFWGQARTVGCSEPARLTLRIKGETITVDIAADGACALSNVFSLETEAVYIDDPFVVDDLGLPPVRLRRYGDHRDRLRQLAASSPDNTLLAEMVAEGSIDKIYRLIDIAFEGDVVHESQHVFGYRRSGLAEDLDIRNISTGMKTFALIKMLLKNGSITDGATIILDEPEIHLHPKWQLVFAEIIVLLHVEFGLHVLLNTHSPYFLQAIEVMTKRHGVSEKCKYYLSFHDEDSNHLRDVTDDLTPVYEKLVEPLRRLADMESAYDD